MNDAQLAKLIRKNSEAVTKEREKAGKGRYEDNTVVRTGKDPEPKKKRYVDTDTGKDIRVADTDADTLFKEMKRRDF